MSKSQLLIRCRLEKIVACRWKATIVVCHWSGKNFCRATYTDEGLFPPYQGVTHSTSLTTHETNSKQAAVNTLAQWKKDGEEFWLGVRQHVSYLAGFGVPQGLISESHYLLIPHYARLELLLQRCEGCLSPVIHYRFGAFYKQQLASWERIAALFQE